MLVGSRRVVFLLFLNRTIQKIIQHIKSTAPIIDSVIGNVYLHSVSEYRYIKLFEFPYIVLYIISVTILL